MESENTILNLRSKLSQAFKDTNPDRERLKELETENADLQKSLAAETKRRQDVEVRERAANTSQSHMAKERHGLEIKLANLNKTLADEKRGRDEMRKELVVLQGRIAQSQSQVGDLLGLKDGTHFLTCQTVLAFLRSCQCRD